MCEGRAVEDTGVLIRGETKEFSFIHQVIHVCMGEVGGRMCIHVCVVCVRYVCCVYMYVRCVCVYAACVSMTGAVCVYAFIHKHSPALGMTGGPAA